MVTKYAALQATVVSEPKILSGLIEFYSSHYIYKLLHIFYSVCTTHQNCIRQYLHTTVSTYRKLDPGHKLPFLPSHRVKWLRGDFFKTRETSAQKYRNALRKK